MSDRPRSAFAVAVATTGWGLLTAVAAPRVLGQRRSQRFVVRGAQVLGVRHVVQGLAMVRWPRTGTAVGAGVDLLHCASMLIAAAVTRRHRRPALLSAAAAAVLGVAELEVRRGMR